MEGNTKPRLLVVDDEEGPRAALKVVFKPDFEVLLAKSGPEALEFARSAPVDVAILDILMGGMSGVEVLRELKQLDPDIQIIMLTAYETLETARQALRLGASDYQNKPFDIPVLRECVARAVQKRTAALEVRAVAAQIETLRTELKERLEQTEIARATGDIYASVIHDLNSPLTVINGFVELISQSIDRSNVVEGDHLLRLRANMGKVQQQVNRCIDISRRYLSFVRSAATASEQRVRVNQVLVDLQELLTRHSAAANHTLTLRELESDSHARIQGTDLLQVLLNLTINALQATDTPQRVTIAAHLQTKPLDIPLLEDRPGQRFIGRDTFQNQPPMVTISIQDGGGGIPEEILVRLFHEKLTTKPAGQGTGLGLSIVKRLLTQAGGGIHLRTCVGEGSTFTVCIPVAQ